MSEDFDKLTSLRIGIVVMGYWVEGVEEHKNTRKKGRKTDRHKKLLIKLDRQICMYVRVFYRGQNYC